MKKFKLVLIFYLSVFLSGCAGLMYSGLVNYCPPIKSPTNLNTKNAYFYGRFSLERDPANFRRFALQAMNMDLNRMYSIRLLDKPSIYAVQVQPGTYQLQGFIYAPVGAMDFEVEQIPFPKELSYLKETITVAAGKCYYLGEFYGVSKFGNLNNYIASASAATSVVLATTALFPDAQPGSQIDKAVTESIENIMVSIKTRHGVTAVGQDFSNTTKLLKQAVPQLRNFDCQAVWEEKNAEIY